MKYYAISFTRDDRRSNYIESIKFMRSAFCDPRNGCCLMNLSNAKSVVDIIRSRGIAVILVSPEWFAAFVYNAKDNAWNFPPCQWEYRSVFIHEIPELPMSLLDMTKEN